MMSYNDKENYLIPFSVILVQFSLLALWFKKPVIWIWLWFLWSIIDEYLGTKQK